MAWVIANTSSVPKFYAFDVLSDEDKKLWDLVELEGAEFSSRDVLLLTPDVLRQLLENQVGVFEKKSSAREELKRLHVGTCRYIEIKLPITKEYLENLGV